MKKLELSVNKALGICLGYNAFLKSSDYIFLYEKYFVTAIGNTYGEGNEFISFTDEYNMVSPRYNNGIEDSIIGWVVFNSSKELSEEPGYKEYEVGDYFLYTNPVSSTDVESNPDGIIGYKFKYEFPFINDDELVVTDILNCIDVTKGTFDIACSKTVFDSLVNQGLTGLSTLRIKKQLCDVVYEFASIGDIDNIFEDESCAFSLCDNPIVYNIHIVAVSSPRYELKEFDTCSYIDTDLGKIISKIGSEDKHVFAFIFKTEYLSHKAIIAIDGDEKGPIKEQKEHYLKIYKLQDTVKSILKELLHKLNLEECNVIYEGNIQPENIIEISSLREDKSLILQMLFQSYDGTMISLHISDKDINVNILSMKKMYSGRINFSDVNSIGANMLVENLDML